MSFEFREALTEEIPALTDLVNSAYRGESSRKGWTTEADFLDGQRVDSELISDFLNTPNSTVLVACPTDEDDLLGCVHLKKVGVICQLGMLTVAPSLQKRGLGKQMLEEAEAFAQFWDCSHIEIKVISLRQELINWYKKHGFALTSEKSPFPYGEPRFGIPKRDDLEFITMRKSLL